VSVAVVVGTAVPSADDTAEKLLCVLLVRQVVTLTSRTNSALMSD
jgi:hypothetical protein